MRKKNLFFALAAGMVMFSACSNDDDVINGGNNGLNEEVQQIVLQVASSGDGLKTRAGRPLESSEAKQSIENVKIIICSNDGKVAYVTTVSDWNNSGSTEYTTNGHGRQATIEIPKADKLAAGNYKVYAIGYSTDSDYDLSSITSATKGGTFNANTTLSFKADAKNTIGEEIFAGDLNLTVEEGKGFKTPIVLNRQVAGSFAYVKDIPYIEGAAKLQLVASSRNTKLVLGKFGNYDLTENGTGNDGHVNYVVNGTEAATDKVIYTIDLSDWFTEVKDADNNALIDTDNNWIGDGDKYAEGSVFGGNFVIPFKKVDNTATFTLQLTKEDGTSLREWSIKLPQAQTSNSLTEWTGSAFEAVANYTESVEAYSVVRNHLYGIGTRTLDEPEEPGEDPDVDVPESLNTKQELTLRVNDNWEVIHTMEIE